MMRRRFLIALLFGMLSLHSHGQQVVIDPSQIAASATNAANQIDYMLDQLGELAHLGDQMNTMREHIDNVFGEDGIGGKTARSRGTDIIGSTLSGRLGRVAREVTSTGIALIQSADGQRTVSVPAGYTFFIVKKKQP